MRDPIERQKTILAYLLKQRFPWLGTGAPDNFFNVCADLAAWYKELTQPDEDTDEQPSSEVTS